MADTSLDDIIKQRRIRPLMQTARINFGGKNIGKGNQKPQQNLNNPNMKVMGDMRNKIIQKKRLRMFDARDRLAELAKQGDARDRLNKIRRKNIVFQKKVLPLQKKPVPLIKKIHNENNPSNLSGQTQMRGSKLMRTVASSDVGEKNPVSQLGPPARTAANGRTREAGRYQVPVNSHLVTIKNKKRSFVGGPNIRIKTQVTKHPSRPIMQPVSRAMEPVYSGRGGMMRGYSPEPEHVYRSRSPHLQNVRPTRLKITTSNNYREPSPVYNDEWDMPPARMPAQRMPPAHIPESPPQRMTVRPVAKKRPMYEAENERGPTKKLAPLSTELLARLDQPSRAVPQGYKVIVNNLYSSVNVEDIEELFGTIGPIVSARMLRQGVAEAIFVTQEDAYRSVEVFNHRQLDGQPMCVSVVGRQAVPTAPTPPAQTSSHTTSVLKAASGGGGTVMPRSMMRTGTRRSEDIVAPNITAIHQALFKHH